MLRSWLSELSRRLAQRLQALAERLSESEPAPPPVAASADPVPGIDPSLPPEHWLRLIEARSPRVAQMFARRQPRHATAIVRPQASPTHFTPSPNSGWRSNSPAAPERPYLPFASISHRESNPARFTPSPAITPNEVPAKKTTAGRMGPVNDQPVSRNGAAGFPQSESVPPREKVSEAPSIVVPAAAPSAESLRKSVRLHSLAPDTARKNPVANDPNAPPADSPAPSTASTSEHLGALTRSPEPRRFPTTSPPTPVRERAVERKAGAGGGFVTSRKVHPPSTPDPVAVHAPSRQTTDHFCGNGHRNRVTEPRIPPSARTFESVPAARPRWAELPDPPVAPSAALVNEALDEAERRRHLELDQRG